MSSMSEPGWLERLAGEVALRAVAYAQRRAIAREDMHEAMHLTAMVLYGNSSHSLTAPCPLPESFWEDGDALAKASRERRAARANPDQPATGSQP